MCGIAGWVSFARDLTVESSTVDAMTDALSHRGPDARGVWIAKHAALGHTRTSVIDLVGGGQPMVVEEDGRPIAALTYSGEVYNFRELRGMLEQRGHRFRTRSDTEVVLRAYLEWGVDCPVHLEGMFAFAVWDIRRDELLLVRDRMGIKPLFYAVKSDNVLFASEPKSLLANPLIRPTVDADGLREIFSTAKTPGQAVFRDMHELRPGHTITVSRNGIVERRYWALQARPHADDLETTIRTIRTMLGEIVTRELVADVPLCTALSGGIDSSAVTALAAITRQQTGHDPIRTITATFVGYSEHFRPDDTRDTPDAPYAAELARHVGADHTDIVLTPVDLMDPAARMAALVAQDMPTTLGDMDTSLYLMLRTIRERSTVALLGETADEIFGGYNWLYEPDIVAAANYPWVAAEMRHQASHRGHGRGLFDPGFMRKLDMAGYYADSYQTARAQTPHQEGESPREHRMRELSYFHLARWLPMLLDRDDRLAMASGLETRVPYCDHRLVEYVYNTPWSFKTFDGREKSLLRAAVWDLLPASVLERPKSPFPVTQDPAYTKALQAEMRVMLADPNAPIHAYLDVAATKEAIADTSAEANDWHSRINLETAYGFNAWLRHYHVDIAL
jgi:asparagine synthase (glutamine-hydrolysing)